MNRTEKIALQAKNKHQVLAFKEGFFYKVYNEGAYLLQDKHYKLQSNGKGNLKCIYVGFTEAVIDKLKVECKLEKTNDYYIIHTAILLDTKKYKVWYESEISKTSLPF